MNANDYENKLAYPQKENFTVTYYYKNGEKIGTRRANDPVIALPVGTVQEKVVDEEAFKIARTEYSKHSQRLAELFIIDLFQDNGLPDNEFTRALYSIAYSQGHSSGYSEIASIFDDLANLVDVAKKVYGK
jgi:hypothetical protein